MKKEMLSSLGRNGNKDVVVKLSCFPTRFLCGVSRFFISDEWSSVRNKIGRCRIKCGKTPNLMGFTLIELLVVVLIIGILAAVAVPQYQKAVMKSRYATLKNLVRSLGNAEERYYLANNSYTTDVENLDIEFSETPTSVQVANADVTIYLFPWGQCDVIQAVAAPRVVCRNNSINLKYKIYLTNGDGQFAGKTACTLISTTDSKVALSRQLCLQETGDTNPYAGVDYLYQ